MQYLFYLLSVLLYGCHYFIAYHPEARNSKWFIPAGLLLALFVNGLWLLLVKFLDDKHKIMVASFWWDGLLVLPMIVVPLLFFGIRPNITSLVGMGLIIIGMVLTKV